MIILELLSAVVVAFYLVLKSRTEVRPGAYLARMGALALAAWLGEETLIGAYGFWHHNPTSWSVFIDRVPLLVVLIWPVILDSALSLSKHFAAPGDARTPLVVGALVLVDASLIEPVAVKLGLWSWSVPGLFGVPPIGFLGWAVFAGVAVYFLARAERAWSGWAALRLIVAAPLATHGLLFGLWWGGLRWMSAPVPEWPATGIVLGLALTIAAVARIRLGRGAPMREIVARIPGAALLYACVALHARGNAAFVAFSLGYAVLYAALTPWEALSRPRASR